MNGMDGCIDMRRIMESAFGFGFHAWCPLRELYLAALRRITDYFIFENWFGLSAWIGEPTQLLLQPQ